ncbi:hypothetical protein ACLMJK_007915 [Lecanora helva]
MAIDFDYASPTASEIAAHHSEELLGFPEPVGSGPAWGDNNDEAPEVGVNLECETYEVIEQDAGVKTETEIMALKAQLEEKDAEILRLKAKYSESKSINQQQTDRKASKSLHQVTKMEKLKIALAYTETQLRTSESNLLTFKQRHHEASQKILVLASDLNARTAELESSRVKAKDALDQLRSLYGERADLKADNFYLSTSHDQKNDKISTLKKMKEEHAKEKDDLEDRIVKLERQCMEAAARAESWRMKWQDLRDAKERIVMYSDPSGDVTMIDPPGAAMKVDIPWVLEAGQENIKLRLEIENLNERLQEAKEAAISAGKKESDEAIDFRLKFEASQKELGIVKKDLDVAVKDYLGMLQDMEMDPTNLYHPVYKKIEGLKRYIKESEEEKALVQARLEHERAISWDRRTSMVLCLS